MTKSFIELLNPKPIIIVFCLFSIFSNGVIAQNTSYNLNSIPISGGNNSVFGSNSFLSNIGGGLNTAIGSGTLQSNTYGFYNSAIGAGALLSNTTGSYNTSNGSLSLYNNTIGSYNTANGIISLLSNITGTFNTALGYFADVASGNLSNATAIGYGALVKANNTMQLGNSEVTAVYAGTGINATLVAGGLQITGGSLAVGNVLTSDAFGVATWQPASGGGAAWSLTGNINTIDGTNYIGTNDNVPFNIRVNNQRAGRLDATLKNTFYGVLAGNSNNTDGINNTAIGYSSLPANTSGNSNVAVGSSSLLNNTSGSFNTSVGVGTLDLNTTGSGNSAFGLAALFENSNGDWNTGIGSNALGSNTSGSNNTACGLSSLFTNTTGDNNTACSLSALEGNNTGNSNSALGYFASVNSSAYNNATSLGALALAHQNNMVRIGDVNVTLIEGQPQFYTGSDGRFKFNISEEDVKGLDFISRLRPVVYNFDTRKFQEFLTEDMPDSIRYRYFQGQNFEYSTSIRRSGFIAQEVEAAAIESGYSFDGVHIPQSKKDNYSLAYGEFVVPLVKAMQELNTQNKAMKQAMHEQRKVNESLKKEMDELRAMLKTVTNENKEGSIKIMESNAGAQLFQNAPNPFNKLTIIRYSIPADAKKAIIAITSSDGIKMSEFNLKSNKGQGIEITGGSLPTGTYIYSLFVDNKLIDSKKMILTR